MKRGNLVTVSAPGDYGKPRPAVIIQSDGVTANDSVLVCLVTSTLIELTIYRLTLEPTSTNGLRSTSQVLVDKIIAMPREKCGSVIGSLEPTMLSKLDAMLAVILGLAD
jgi:mRNA interferase MazF